MDLMQLLYAVILSGIVVTLAYWRGSLSPSGGWGALIIGTLTLGFGGWQWGVILAVFFVSSSLLSHFKEAEKKATNVNIEPPKPLAQHLDGTTRRLLITGGVIVFAISFIFSATASGILGDTISFVLGIWIGGIAGSLFSLRKSVFTSENLLWLILESLISGIVAGVIYFLIGGGTLGGIVGSVSFLIILLIIIRFIHGKK